jgi:hypothetical protein
LLVKNPRIKKRGQKIGKVKAYQKRHTPQQQQMVYIVTIATRQETQKTDVSRRKEK